MIVEKTYLCEVIGAGTQEDPRRPRLADLPFRKSWFMHELGSFGGKEWCLVSVVAEVADHDKIALGEGEVVVALKGMSVVDVESLRAKFAKIGEKLETARKCMVTLDDKTGREVGKEK
jgi:hypothetical protein